MDQACQRASLTQERCRPLLVERCREYFERGGGGEVEMLAQIDLSESSSAKQLEDLIVAKALSFADIHVFRKYHVFLRQGSTPGKR